jgi:hypothetical protein
VSKNLWLIRAEGILIFCLLFLCLASALPAWGKKEKSASQEKTTQASGGKVDEGKKGNEVPDAGEKSDEAVIVQVSGRVRLVGSGLFTEIVITGPDKEWYIVKEEEHKLKDLQQQMVAVKGEETITELRFANGVYAGERRTLKNIEIITAE